MLEEIFNLNTNVLGEEESCINQSVIKGAGQVEENDKIKFDNTPENEEHEFNLEKIGSISTSIHKSPIKQKGLKDSTKNLEEFELIELIKKRFRKKFTKFTKFKKKTSVKKKVKELKSPKVTAEEKRYSDEEEVLLK